METYSPTYNRQNEEYIGKQSFRRDMRDLCLFMSGMVLLSVSLYSGLMLAEKVMG